MTEQVEEIETPEVEQAEEVIDQTEGGETPEENVNDVGEGAPEDMGLVVEIGGEEEDDGAPEWVKNVRRENRELKKQLKALQSGDAGSTVGLVALPPEPQLEDFDYDQDAFKQAHKDWVRKSIAHERAQEEAEALREKQAQRWEAKLGTYEAGKEKIGAADFDDAEATVSEIFAKPFPGILADDVRMGIIKQGAKDPTTLVYALGRNPEKAKALAEIDDPVEFAFALGEISATMKVVRSGSKPAPEKRISGGSAPGVTATVDRTLERLREEAAKTGDFTKVVAYKRQLKK